MWELHFDRLITRSAYMVCLKSVKVHFFNLTERQSAYLAIVLVPPTMMVVKLTFFLLYLHIFYQNKKLKFYIWAGAFLSTAFYMSVAITQFIFATPPNGMSLKNYYFTPRFNKTTILSVPMVAVGLGIDLYILVLPIGGVMQLHMPARRKIGVCVIFITGILFVISWMQKSCFV